MSPEDSIRNVITTWMRASAEGDLETLATLMAEDVVFLTPGQPPIRGRDNFLTLQRAMQGNFHMQGTAEFQEVRVDGERAYAWTYLTVVITPAGGGDAVRRAGHTLSIFRRDPNGAWVLSRDANLMGASERLT